MKEAEMVRIADLIERALAKPEDEAHLADVKKNVRELAHAFPMYADLLKR